MLEVMRFLKQSVFATTAMVLALMIVVYFHEVTYSRSSVIIDYHI